MRDKVLGYGWHFRPKWSSNSMRRPRLFDWTDDPAQATCDVAVYMDTAIRSGVDQPGRKIAWLLESPAISRWQGTIPFIEDNLHRVLASYEWLLTSDRSLCRRHPRIVYNPPASNLPWMDEDRYAIYRKSKLCSMFASKKKMVEGHLYRQQVAQRLKDKLDLFGGACGSARVGGERNHPDKSEGILPYMFHVVLENTKVDFYYTEKITDCFATGTVPVYGGSPCIAELFDRDGILFFDDDFDPDCLTEDLYYEMMPAIRRNFLLVQQLEGSDDLLYRRFIRGAAPGRELPPWKRECEQPPRPAAGRGATPWRPWQSDEILASARANGDSPDERLRIVRTQHKTPIRSLEQVPAEQVSVRRVDEAMQPARSLAAPDGGWLPEIHTAFLLRLGDAYIGDNVIFDAQRYYGMGRWWLGTGWRRYAGIEEVRHVDAAVSIGAWGGEAFQHFVFDALPPLAAVIDLLEQPEMRHLRIVSHNQPGKQSSWWWKRLGVEDRIVAKPVRASSGFVIHADLALFPQFEPNHNQLGLYPRNLLRPIQRRLGTLEPARRDLAVYLRRTSKRSVAGEKEMLEQARAAVEESGLKLHVLGGLGRIADAEPWIRRARIVFGPHGGAFANLIFAQPGTAVVEFVPRRALEEGRPNDRLSMYYGLSQAAGLDYWFVDPKSYDHDAPGMQIDAGDVADTLRLALGAPRRG